MGYDMRIAGELPTPDEAETVRLSTEVDAALEKLRVFNGRLFQKVQGVADEAKAALMAEHADEKARVELEYEAARSAYDRVADPGYFRLNIFGMGRYLDAMDALGMVHASTSPIESDQWPDYPDEDVIVYGTPEHDAAMAEYERAKDALTSSYTGPEPTMPSHKLAWNDGHLVTPDEIKASLAKWEQRDKGASYGDEIDKTIASDYWAQWIEYLTLAADSDGFRVH